MRAWLVGWGVVLAVASSVHDAPAQSITGVVVEADSATAAPFVTLVVRTAAGRVVVRGQSSVRGTFSLVLPGGGRYSLQALRVGFIPTVVGPLDVADGTATTVRLTLSSVPVQLAPILVAEPARCGAAASEPTDLLTLWEQARSALTAVSSDSTLSVELVRYSRAIGVWPDTSTFRSAQDPVWDRGGSFRSRPASELVRDGFARRVGDEMEYFAPDAHVLVSDAFAEAYCLWRQPGPPAHPEWRGIGFTSGGSQAAAAARTSIEGVLWLEPDGRLRTLEYRYRGLPQAAAEAHAGGTMTFVELPSRQWIVSRWSMRLPELVIERRSTGIGLYRRVHESERLHRIIERGGAALRVAWGEHDTLALAPEPLVLTAELSPGEGAQVVGSEIAPLEGGASQLLGPSFDLEMTAAPGVRRLLVRTPLMRALAFPPDTVAVLALPEAGVLRGKLRLPSSRDIAARACPRAPGQRGETSAIVLGRVRPDATPSATTATSGVRDRPLPSFRRVRAGAPAAPVPARVRWVSTNSDAWVACNVPRGVPLAVVGRGTDGAEVEDTRFRIPSAQHVLIVGETVQSLAGLPAAAVVTEAAVRRAMLTVRVRDAAGATPITDAQVTLDDARSTPGDATGVYRFPSVAEGEHVVHVRRLGFVPVEDLAIVDSAGTTVEVRLHPLAALLPEVVVNGRRVSVHPRYAEVIRRAQSNWGTLFTREDFRGTNRLETMLEQIPGVHLLSTNELAFARCQDNLLGKSPEQGSRSWTQVYIDGVRVTTNEMNSIEEAFRSVPPSDIEFVEVYRGVSRIPVEFVNDACSVIAIWTKAW